MTSLVLVPAFARPTHQAVAASRIVPSCVPFARALVVVVLMMASFLPEPLYLVMAAKKSKAHSSSDLIVRLLSVDMCRDRESYIVECNTTLTQYGAKGTVGVDMDYTVSKSAKSFSKFELIMVKCREAVTANSCEYYQTWKYSLGVCNIINAPLMPWSTSIDSMTPRFKCPFAKGKYMTRNATVDVNVLKTVPFPWEGNIWRSNVLFFNEHNELHLCFTADLEIKRVKT